MTTPIRRILSAVAAAGVISLATAGPAAAEHERGAGPYSVNREGYVDDADLVYLRSGLGALLGLGLTGAAVAGLHRRGSRGAGRPSGELSDLEPTPRPGLA